MPLTEGVLLEISPRARRISLRVDVARGCIVLVRPKRCPETLITRFVTEKRDWITKQLASLPARMVLSHGSALTLLGENCVISEHSTAKRGVWRESSTIYVSGAPEHLPRRLKDWLKAEARTIFSAWARDFAARLNVRVTRVALRDTKSRWGSCTRDGKLSLSWRLMLAPRDIAAYVVAHEVAHLKHMNHSPAFWRVVESLVGNIKTPRAWLRRHGSSLHRFQ
jgi:predicted metal-dependent hydrolase